jgi:hypothetical protein
MSICRLGPDKRRNQQTIERTRRGRLNYVHISIAPWIYMFLSAFHSTIQSVFELIFLIQRNHGSSENDANRIL